MKIYLIDNKKIDKYVLPTKVDSAFLMPYRSLNSDEDSIVTIEAEAGKWKLKSNGNVNIVNNQETVEEMTLDDYSFYYLKILGRNEYIMLYASPTIEKEIYALDYSKLTNIKIGNSKDCNILYNSPLVDNIQCEITKVENSWVIETKSTNFYTYVNNQSIIKHELKIGDVIFLNGLKIVWMNGFLKINNPKSSVSVKDLTAYNTNDNVNNSTYEQVDEEESSINLYKDDDYFFHTPRMREKVEHLNLEIDAPPNKDDQPDIPFLLSIGTSLTMLASSFVTGYSVFDSLSTGKKTLMGVLPQIIMCLAMIIGSLVIPRLMTAYNKRKRRKREELRQTKYKAYLDKKEQVINQTMKQHTLIEYANNPSAFECSNMIINNDKKLWSRQINDGDFLAVRLGIGDKDTDLTIKAPEEHFTLDEDNLFESVYRVVEKAKLLKDVPITYSLTSKPNISFIFNTQEKEKYLNSIITQIVANHSANDVKLVILTNKKQEKNWEYTKFLPHCWSDNKNIRFFATNQDELRSIASYLEEEYKMRRDQIKDAGKDEEGLEDLKKDQGFKNFSPYYLIFCDNYKTAKKEAIADMICKNEQNLGFSLITMSNSTRDLPSTCETFISITTKDGCILGEEIETQSQVQFKLDAIPDLDMKALSVKLANIPILSKDESAGLPNMISFLEMYNVSKVEQLNILNRWKSNNPVVNLSTPVGVKTTGELFMLDLHEKFHGPHGLIAGSTGSGKSEFIITYILSMAVNYHPYEVQFVLIDYKGGGLAGAFENKATGVHIPHLAGTITNLDTSEMNRTLVSIESELKRRQRIFNEVKDSLDESTIDIYKYQRLYREGVVKEPLAHLFIITDEFAELKSQRPEFMDQLITTARIGRSLGVHLILATQKPSGVVNDQIWSNSKFKVCLKVQDRSDSMEMLKKPDAASLKDVGRFYLQVGYDDYFDIGQSAWGGAKYVPSNRILKKVDDSINFVNNVGYVVKTINDLVKENSKNDKNGNLGDQLTNTVKYIYQLSESENIKRKKLWLDIIPGFIYVNDLKVKYNYKPNPFFINPVIGEYDKPTKQEQGLLNLDLTNGGNTVIYGQSGSGKELLATTIIWSTIAEHTPQEVNFYIIDCGAETLKVFNNIPHVGEVATVDEQEKINNIFTMVYEEMERRRDLFSDYSGSYINYCENSGNKLPLIIVVINGYDIFSETFNKLSEAVQPIYRECAKFGINFIITAATTAAVRSRMAQNFNNKIALQLPNDDDYRTVIQSAPRKLIPAKYVGRGIIEKNDEVFEFQTAYIYEPSQINSVIKKASEILNQSYTERAKRITVVPEEVTLDLVINEATDLAHIPIGYNLDTKNIYKYNFTENNINIVLSTEIAEKMEFVYAIAKEFKKYANVVVVDFLRIFNTNIDGVSCYKNDFDKIMIAINNQIENDANSNNKNIYIMVGIGTFTSKVSPNIKPILNNIFNKVSTLKNNMFLFVDDYSSYKNMQLEPWYSTQVNNTSGIWLGDGIGSQIAINVTNIDAETRKKNFAYMGFAITKGKLTTIKCVVDVEEQNEK